MQYLDGIDIDASNEIEAREIAHKNLINHQQSFSTGDNLSPFHL